MKEGIDIIDNYRDLTIGLYMDILTINADNSLEEIDRQVKTIALLAGMSEDEVLDLPIPEYKALSLRASFLESPATDLTSRIAKTYRVGAFTLIPTTDIRKLTTAQYIDFQSFHSQGMDSHLPEILSCLLIPEGKHYNAGYDILEVQKAIRENLSVADAVGLYAFFLTSSGKSLRDILTFCKAEATKVKDRKERERILKSLKEQENRLEKSGVGWLL